MFCKEFYSSLYALIVEYVMSEVGGIESQQCSRFQKFKVERSGLKGSGNTFPLARSVGKIFWRWIHIRGQTDNPKYPWENDDMPKNRHFLL